jgi:hypothetical protein
VAFFIEEKEGNHGTPLAFAEDTAEQPTAENKEPCTLQGSYIVFS